MDISRNRDNQKMNSSDGRPEPDQSKPEVIQPKPCIWQTYDATDGREALDAPDSVLRVLRGGSFLGAIRARCALRSRSLPGDGINLYGFRVVLTSLPD